MYVITYILNLSFLKSPKFLAYYSRTIILIAMFLDSPNPTLYRKY